MILLDNKEPIVEKLIDRSILPIAPMTIFFFPMVDTLSIYIYTYSYYWNFNCPSQVEPLKLLIGDLLFGWLGLSVGMRRKQLAHCVRHTYEGFYFDCVLGRGRTAKRATLGVQLLYSPNWRRTVTPQFVVFAETAPNA